MAPRLTVIGIDAATADVIGPLAAQGELPHLAALLERSSHGTLHSTIHPITSQAWATMVTGVNAGRHGLWDFTERDASGYRLRLVNGGLRRAPAIWDILSAQGRRVGIVNVPFTWPAPDVNGCFVAGLDAAARSAGMTSPPDLLGRLRRRFGPLELDHEMPLDADGRFDVAQARRGVAQKADLACWLAETYDPELLFVVFMAADHVQHIGWTEWEELGAGSRVAEVYRALDDAVGRLVALAGPDGDIVLVSDHGAGPSKGAINLNRWLADEGLLSYAEGARRAAPSELARRALYRLLEQRRRLPRGLRNALKQRAPGLREHALALREFTAIDFGRTQAFAYGNMGNIAINVRGREARGVVEPGAEYERVRDRIIERAQELRDPHTGERVVATVHRREELFAGPALDRVPDLIVEFVDYAWSGKGNLMAKTPTVADEVVLAKGWRERHVGTHRTRGVIALAGPSVEPGPGLDARMQDVAPTLLYLLDAAIPLDLEGRVLAEALSPALLDERVPDVVADGALALAGFAPSAPNGYAAADVEAVEERLRSLGYLD